MELPDNPRYPNYSGVWNVDGSKSEGAFFIWTAAENNGICIDRMGVASLTNIDINPKGKFSFNKLYMALLPGALSKVANYEGKIQGEGYFTGRWKRAESDILSGDFVLEYYMGNKTMDALVRAACNKVIKDFRGDLKLDSAYMPTHSTPSFHLPGLEHVIALGKMI